MIRANWSNVTLAEYDALNIIRRSDAELILNRYWDEVHSADPMRLPGDVATRLSDSGREWLTDANRIYHTSTDEHELIRLAGEFVRSFGTLATVRSARIAREVTR